MLVVHGIATRLLTRVVGRTVLGASVPMEMATLVAVMVSTVPLFRITRQFCQFGRRVRETSDDNRGLLRVGDGGDIRDVSGYGRQKWHADGIPRSTPIRDSGGGRETPALMQIHTLSHGRDAGKDRSESNSHG